MYPYLFQQQDGFLDIIQIRGLKSQGQQSFWFSHVEHFGL